MFRVKALCEKAGLSETQIVSMLNEGTDTYADFCEGERQLPLDRLEKVCDLFGLTVHDLLEGRDGPVAPLRFAFPPEMISGEDLRAVADINRIALNLDWMRQMIENSDAP